MYSNDMIFIIDRIKRMENKITLIERNIREGGLLYGIVFISSWVFIKYII
jgi:hypothetical protein